MCSQPGTSHQGHYVPLWERGWWCCAAQHPAGFDRQLPPLELFLGPFAGVSEHLPPPEVMAVVEAAADR